jgi:hypothetical protein
MSTAWFATREDVRSALSSASSARDDAQIDRALASATTAVSELCHRDFQPVLTTRTFDWPDAQTPRSWRQWLDRNELISASLVVSGGVTIPATDYYLEPNNDGPPYDRIEIRLDRQSAWSMGSTHQRAISVTGWFGYRDDQAAAGALAAAITSTTATTATVTDSTAVGVGDLLSCGAERMTVANKRLVSTGQTLQSPLGAAKNDVLMSVADTTAFAVGETLTLGAERVWVRDITDTLLVERAYDGTQLDSHSGETIWAPRLLTLTRGAAGTLPATAAGGTALTRWAPPGMVKSLAVAEAMCTLYNEQAGYARTVRTQAGSGTRSVAAVTVERDNLRAQVYSSLGRQARIRAV